VDTVKRYRAIDAGIVSAGGLLGEAAI